MFLHHSKKKNPGLQPLYPLWLRLAESPSCSKLHAQPQPCLPRGRNASLTGGLRCLMRKKGLLTNEAMNSSEANNSSYKDLVRYLLWGVGRWFSS